MARMIALAALVTSSGFAVFFSDMLLSALFLGVASTAASITYYLFGAVQASLVEISMGAGLTTILFILSITLSGIRMETYSRPAATRTVGLWFAITILVAMTYSLVAQGQAVIADKAPVIGPIDVAPVLWGSRLMDLWALVFIIVSAGVGVATLCRLGGTSK